MIMEEERAPLQLMVIDIMAGLLRQRPEDIRLEHSLLNDLYLDSLHVLELLTLLEQRFGFETDAEDLQPHVFSTVESVVTFVREKAAS
ncbi:acyl carrier protein [Paenibacillus luteus]|uniref:acyl carrier protein n=1 Tax=Paenibacillus luteus TaxID=2545753 RepID=UPI00114238DD|nr:acyl carrier protein [Paenibacillus luteus]